MMVRFTRSARREKTCAAWNPPEGAGRDTHICMLDAGHEGQHTCKCAATWWTLACPVCPDPPALKPERFMLGLQWYKCPACGIVTRPFTDEEIEALGG